MRDNSKLYASIATSIIVVLLFLLLWFFGLSLANFDKEEGLMISFGSEVDGYGLVDPSQVLPQPKSANYVPFKSNEEQLMTQDVEETVVIAKKEKVEKKKDPVVVEDPEKIKKQKEFEERIKEEKRLKEERERVLAEQAKISETARANAAKAFSGTDTSGGTTEGATEGVQGNPAGSGSSGGNSWSLAGRDIKGDLYKPQYSGQQEGRVIVQIRVDRNGNVTSASVLARSSITDEGMRKACEAAALKTKFTAGTGVSEGIITYRFVMN